MYYCIETDELILPNDILKEWMRIHKTGTPPTIIHISNNLSIGELREYCVNCVKLPSCNIMRKRNSEKSINMACFIDKETFTYKGQEFSA